MPELRIKIFNNFPAAHIGSSFCPGLGTLPDWGPDRGDGREGADTSVGKMIDENLAGIYLGNSSNYQWRAV